MEGLFSKFQRNRYPSKDCLSTWNVLLRMGGERKKRQEEGEEKKKNKHLKFLASRLIIRGNQELAQSALLEVDRLNNQQGFSEAGQKEIKYGTRSLFLLPSPEQ